MIETARQPDIHALPVSGGTYMEIKKFHEKNVRVQINGKYI